MKLANRVVKIVSNAEYCSLQILIAALCRGELHRLKSLFIIIYVWKRMTGHSAGNKRSSYATLSGTHSYSASYR